MLDTLKKLGCALLLIAAPAATWAADPYPCKTVRFVVPYPPGGASDLLARMLVPGLTDRLGTTIVVENVSGAGGNIGTGQVSGAKPDGCTWLLGNSSGIVISRNLYKLQHDPIKQLTPVAELAAIPMVLYVNSQVPANSFDELVELARAEPDTLAYATPGSGTTHHLLTELLKQQFDVKLTHVPYRGSGPAIQDMLAGHVAVAFEGTSAIVSHLDSGRIRALATTGEQRSSALPDLPTMKELGHPKFVVTNWYGVFVPAGTPDALVERLNTSIRDVMKTPDVQKSLKGMDSQMRDLDVAQYRQLIDAEAPYWEALVKETGVRID